MTFPRIEYVIFDLDGLMIDSERVYTDVTNDILARYGKSMTWEIKAGLMGKPEREAAVHLLSFFPGIELTPDSYLNQRNVAQNLLWPTVPLLPGIRKLVHHLYAHGIPIAVATGTRREEFKLKTQHLQHVFECFAGNVVCGDDVDATGGTIRGKPHPDVFLVAARERLARCVGSKEQGECSEGEAEERRKGLVFEDALPGMQAGRRAGMSVVWVPDVNLLDIEYEGVEMGDQILKSVKEFVPEMWGLPPYGS